MADAMKDRPGWETEAAETSLAGDENSLPAGSDIGALLAPLVGTDIPGGCDECPDPYQTVERLHGVWLLTVHHDDGCPRLVRYRRGGAA